MSQAPKAPMQRRSDRLLRALAPFSGVVIVAHDNPDPDAIASGWAVHRLLSARGIKARLVAGGGVVRAENREMLRLLQPPLELTAGVEVREGEAAVLVDCNPEASHHLLAGGRDIPMAVIDHHESKCSPRGLLFCDQRTSAAATATIAACYLKEQGVVPDAKLASALIYALRSETRGGEFWHSRTDRSVVAWLTPLADPSLIARIENAPLSRDYFADLVLAIQSTFIYENAALCLLPRASGAEILGEVADLLARAEGVDRVLCAAAVNGDILVSVRTTEAGGNATVLVQRVLTGIGGGGGHARRAGGKIAGKGDGAGLPPSVEDELRGRWLDACGLARQSRGVRIVRVRDIAANLA